MNKPTLTIFANFRINNEERYQRMKDSFESFKDINATKWVVNVRGLYKLKTILFLREHLGEKLYSYTLESRKGWFYDTRNMLPQIDTDFVFFWIEDHINMVDVDIYEEILSEMKENKCDQLTYSWYMDSYSKIFEPIKESESERLNFFYINKKNIKIVEDINKGFFYTVAAQGIFSVSFFLKIINCNPKVRRHLKDTPFDFEKRSTDLDFINFKYSLPKFELFACIDDNLFEDNYCLIDRGLYISKFNRIEMLKSERIMNSKIYELKFFLHRAKNFLLKFINIT